MTSDVDYRLCIAPMMDRTDRHFRYFMRLISRRVRLYTEMITTGALLHGDRDRFLQFDPAEHPLAVQLGGSNPQQLADCAQLCEDRGYDEINLNVGCPSDRVQSGAFGACLMNLPERVAECIAAMNHAVDIPVTIKCRTGVDDRDRYEDLFGFISMTAGAGCTVFIVHARKAWLSGLSPKQNREVPPLQYDMVYQLKRDFPQLTIVINGGFNDMPDIRRQLDFVDGVMIGRAAYAEPWLLASADALFGAQDGSVPTRIDILRRLLPYVRREIAQGARLQQITRHILGLFQNQPGARRFRRWLSENAYKPAATTEVLERAIEIMETGGAG